MPEIWIIVQNINKLYEQVEGKVLKSNFTFKPVISAHSEFIWPQCKERAILLGTLAFFNYLRCTSSRNLIIIKVGLKYVEGNIGRADK